MYASERVLEFLDDMDIIRGYYSVVKTSPTSGQIELGGGDASSYLSILEEEFPSMEFRAGRSVIFFEESRGGYRFAGGLRRPFGRVQRKPYGGGLDKPSGGGQDKPPVGAFIDAKRARTWEEVGVKLAEGWSRYLSHTVLVVYVMDEDYTLPNAGVASKEIKSSILDLVRKADKELADGDESNYYRGLSRAGFFWKKAEIIVEPIVSPTSGKAGHKITIKP